MASTVGQQQQCNRAAQHHSTTQHFMPPHTCASCVSDFIWNLPMKRKIKTMHNSVGECEKKKQIM